MLPTIDADLVVRQMMGVFPAALVARVLDDDQAPSKSRTSYWG
ncbi:hypothetical protein [Galactobacter valiniphilus]|nr:hypothetical protein [Galactobacter valiniphilus]